MISINLIAPEGEQYVIDSLFVRLPTDENSEDTLTDLEIEMSLAEVVPSQGELKRSSTHSRPVLGPGYGLKDWIRFCRRSQDLAGTYGQEKKITPSELAKHCTEDDAWTAINGRVYNITPYLKYHPGSVEEVMKGAGKDCTSLFNEHHSYVQYERLLTKCYVGRLVLDASGKRRKMGVTSLAVPGKPAGKSLSIPSLRPPTLGLTQSLQPVNEKVVMVMEDTDSGSECLNDGGSPISLPVRIKAPHTPDSAISDEDVDGPLVSSKEVKDKLAMQKPRCDWYQTNNTTVLCIYTYAKTVKPTDVMIDIDELSFNGRFFLGNRVYQITGSLPHSVKKTEIAIEGHKVDIIMYKEESGLSWQYLDICLDANGCFVEKSLEVRKATLASVKDVTHNTKVFTLSLPKGSYMNIPTGYHVQLMAEKNGEPVVRSYTPVVPLTSTAGRSKALQCDTVDFMIKLYPDGKMSSILSNLKIGDSLMIGDPEGDFVSETLSTKRNVFLIAAGTGFTPMAKIIRDVVSAKERETEVKLLFANKTEEDILWRSQLQAVQDSTLRFKCVNVLSEAKSEWTGPRGRIDKDFLSQHIPDSSQLKSEEVLFCVCGMSKFQSAVSSALQSIGYSRDSIHLFD